MLSRYLLPETLTGEQIFRYLCGRDSAVFWLDSGIGAEQGKSYLGVSSEVSHCTPGEEGKFIDFLRSRVNQQKNRNGSAGVFAEPSFSLGWVGWFHYEFGVRLLGLSDDHTSLSHETSPPSASMMFVRTMIEINHASNELWLVAEDDAMLHSWLDLHLEALLGSAALSASRNDEDDHPLDIGAIVWRDNTKTYLRNIEACQAAIQRGDAYLLCLTTQASVNTDEAAHEVYLRVRELSPTHHSGFIRIGDTALVSASPERFLAVDERGNAVTKPIKGTRPRGLLPEEDDALMDELVNSEKERAENLMIVDLMRNDFSRVCPPETVRVTSLHAVEHYSHVHQLVSTVTGVLAPENDALDLFSACFPAGSMIGAPKISALEILADLEQVPRGLYSGCFGYVSSDGSLDLAMVIRSIVFTHATASIGTGGGITALSDADAEYDEVQLKAHALLTALQRP
jgi:anthranilate synthase component 1